jgi:rsbT co-antagonist protein RsbR
VRLHPDRFTISADEVVDRVDENTICAVGVLGTSYSFQYDPIDKINNALVALKRAKGLDIPLHVDAASGAFVAPFLNPKLKWDFRLEQVKTINVSGHKFGLVYPGIGWALWRDAADVPESLVTETNVHTRRPGNPHGNCNALRAGGTAGLAIRPRSCIIPGTDPPLTPQKLALRRTYDMSVNGESRIPGLLQRHEPELLAAWVEEQMTDAHLAGRIKNEEVRAQCAEFLGHLSKAAQGNHLADVDSPDWGAIRDMLTELSRSRSLQGFSPAETATFVFSLKKPLFKLIRRECGKDLEALADESWRGTELIDKLGLFTTEAFQKAREEVIRRQQEEMMELSTPVVKLWDGVLALPLIGTLDSNRTQVVMESLLQEIVRTGAGIAILDITGVPTVDTLVAQHLIKTVAAARLMGAECIISGIRPQIAQTIVHLGVDLGDVTTKASLADAFALALQKLGLTVGRARTK